MPYINKASFVRMNHFCVELLSTHFYPEHLKELEKMGWIIQDPFSMVTVNQTQSDPEQKLLRVRLVTKHWKKSNWIRFEIKNRNHDILQIIGIELRNVIEKLKKENQSWFPGE